MTASVTQYAHEGGDTGDAAWASRRLAASSSAWAHPEPEPLEAWARASRLASSAMVTGLACPAARWRAIRMSLTASAGESIHSAR
jgi:hypothetical protein